MWFLKILYFYYNLFLMIKISYSVINLFISEYRNMMKHQYDNILQISNNTRILSTGVLQHPTIWIMFENPIGLAQG